MPSRPILNRYYDREYYNSNQCFLYIGDILVDEITSFQYQSNQSKTPLYGYASQLWDDVAAGVEMVQGNFSINYKEQGYLWVVLRRYFNIRNTEYTTGQNEFLGKRRRALTNKGRMNDIENEGFGGAPIRGSNGTKVNRASIERMISNKTTRSERYKFYQDLAGYSTFSPNTGKDKEFEDIVEIFEDQIWSGKSDKELYKQLRRTEDNAFDGFDIYLTFGNYANPKANHSVVKFENVRLTSRGMIVQLDDSPIQEQYSFIARAYL